MVRVSQCCGCLPASYGAIEWLVAVARLSNSSCVTITYDIDHDIENYYVARLKNRDTIQQ